MVGAGAISAIGGLFGSSKAAKLQKQALNLQRDELNFNKQRYQDYLDKYGGIIDLVIGDAEKGVDPNLGQVTSEASADMATSFKNTQEAIDSKNQRLGINPNSGRADSLNRQLGISQAIATAGSVTNARNTARRVANDETWNRRLGVYQQGNSLINGAANTISTGMSNMASTLANNASQNQNMANQALAGGLGLATQGLLGYLNKPNNTTSVAVDSIADSTKGLKVAGTQVSNGVLFDDTKGISPQTNNSFLG